MRSRRSILLFVTEASGFRVGSIAKGLLDECHRRNINLLWREFDSAWKSGRFAEVPDYLVFWGKPGKLESILHELPRSVPVVSVIGGTMGLPVVTVMPDPRGIAESVAEHLLEQGLRRFVYVGPLENPAGRLRGELFENALRARAADVEVYSFACSFEERFWGGDTRRGRSFLRLVSKCGLPAGVFAFNDQTAVSCMECLIEAGLAVPREIAVAGVDDHPLYTKMYSPLTSVAIDFEEIGRRAARILCEETDRAVRRKTAHVFVGGRLVIRDSSRVRLAGDPVVLKAVEFLHAHFAEPITIADLAQRCGISRSGLSARFSRALGEAPIRHLIRLRLDRAMDLLAEGRLTVSEIAYRTGFEDQAYFTRAFKKHTGLTPSGYREKFRESEGSGRRR